uniref:Uncharacterized protein n=1 Tax=Helianthus annuus TaxID=4232 RepID=A0A251VJ93_HELAN
MLSTRFGPKITRWNFKKLKKIDENRTLAQISGTNYETYYYKTPPLINHFISFQLYKTPLILLLFLFNYNCFFSILINHLVSVYTYLPVHSQPKILKILKKEDRKQKRASLAFILTIKILLHCNKHSLIVRQFG